MKQSQLNVTVLLFNRLTVATMNVYWVRLVLFVWTFGVSSDVTVGEVPQTTSTVTGGVLTSPPQDGNSTVNMTSIEKVTYHLSLNCKDSAVLDSAIEFEVELKPNPLILASASDSYSYQWMTSASGQVLRRSGSLTSIISLTFSSHDVVAGDYLMTVAASWRDNPSVILAYATKKFTLTSVLNGRLVVSQDLEYQRDPNIFATNKDLTLTAVVHDWFLRGDLSYGYFWYQDKEFLDNTKQPSFRTTFYDQTNILLTSLIAVHTNGTDKSTLELLSNKQLGDVKSIETTQVAGSVNVLKGRQLDRSGRQESWPHDTRPHHSHDDWSYDPWDYWPPNPKNIWPDYWPHVRTRKPPNNPTKKPTSKPTRKPTLKPSSNPTSKLPANPTSKLTKTPTNTPSGKSTNKLPNNPSKPTGNPTDQPSSGNPTYKPSSGNPTNKPSSGNPTNKQSSGDPTNKPSNGPTSNPADDPQFVTFGIFQKSVIFKRAIESCHFSRIDADPDDRGVSLKGQATLNISCLGSAPSSLCVNITSTNASIHPGNICRPSQFVDQLHHLVTITLVSTGWSDVHFIVYNDVSRYHLVEPFYGYDPDSFNVPALTVPLIFGVLGIFVLIVGAVYIARARKHPLVEVADFDFHPSLTWRQSQTNRFNLASVFQTARSFFHREQSETDCRTPLGQWRPVPDVDVASHQFYESL